MGATAAIAVAPHIAAPDDIKIERVLSRLNILDIRSPPKNDKKTNKVIQLKQFSPVSYIEPSPIVRPKITMPICKGIVDTLLVIKSISGLQKKENATPKQTEKAALPIINAEARNEIEIKYIKKSI